MRIETLDRNRINMQNKSFKARILIDKDLFKLAVKNLPDRFEVGNRYNSKYIIEEAAIKRPSAFTYNAANCVIFSFFNPEIKLGNKYHLSSCKDNMSKTEEIAQTIYEQAISLKGESKINLEGLIWGGDSKATSQSEDDIKLVKIIIDTANRISKEIGMDCSIITGRKDKNSCVSIASNAINNTHYVYLRILNPDKQIQDVPALLNSYETGIISPKDTLIIPDSITKENYKNELICYA